MQFLVNIAPELAFAVIVAACAFVWWRRRQTRRYDLNRLFDEEETPESGYDALVTEDSGPYCHSCDEPYPAGTRQCPRCRRPL